MIQTQFDIEQAVRTTPPQWSVRDIMTVDPFTVGPHTSIEQARRLMQQHIRHLPVLQHGQVIGILSDRDLQLVLPSPATSLSVYELKYLLIQLTVDEVMTRRVITIAPDQTVTEAVRRMLEHEIGALPVVEQGQLVGLLTRTNLLQAFLKFQGAWVAAA